jgi:LL-H family phage holin
MTPKEVIFMKSALELAQPYLETIATASFGLLAMIILAFITQLRRKVEAWLVARTSTAQRELLHKLAAEAYAWMERQYGPEAGQQKLTEAVRYVMDRLHLEKIGLSIEDVTAAVQKAWQELDAKNRGAA